MSGLLRLALTTPETVARLVAESQAWEKSNNLAYGHGSFTDAVREHTREFFYFYDNRWSLWSTLGFYVQMTTTLLLGFLIGRNGWVRRIPELMPMIKRLQWAALALGIVCSIGFGVIGEFTRAPGPSPLKILGSFCYIFSRLGLMSFYVLSIVRLAQQPLWQRRFAPMAAAGRMPLTNYLLETLMATAIFYGWGGGLWGQVGPAAQLLMAVGLYFVVIVPFSLAWLSRFDYGPLEYVWRLLTYGQRPVGRAEAALR